MRVFRSSEARNGTFTSPNYPDRYPQGINIRYVFQGRDRERVQITFVDIDLHYAPEEASFAVESVSHYRLLLEYRTKHVKKVQDNTISSPR